MPTSSNGSGRHFSENSLTIMDHHDPSLPGSYQEYCEEPPEDHSRGSNGTKDSKGRKKAHLKDGEEAETVVFLNGSVEPGGGTCAWYRMVVCRVLTCGLYRVCQRTILAPCLSGPQDPPENKECSKGEEEEVEDVMEEVKERDDHQDELAWLEDVHFDGVKVDIHRGDLSVVTQAPSSSYGRPPPSGRPEQQQHRTSFRSYDSVTLDDWEEEVRGEEVYSGEGVDALIHKKLLALYTAYQIEELARCTTDSVFVRKSKEIHQLINSLAEEHQMDEQEAECRLVRGIIRISTRRSKKRAPPHYADSGNETMRNSDDSSCSNNNDYKSNPNFQISEVTHSDMYAREMRRNNSEVIHARLPGSGENAELSSRSLFALHGHHVVVGGLSHSHFHKDVILGGHNTEMRAHTGPRGRL